MVLVDIESVKAMLKYVHLGFSEEVKVIEKYISYVS